MTDRWQRADEVLSRRLPDGVIVLSLHRGDPLVVTGPGGELWDLLADERSTSEVVAALAEHFGAEPTTVHDEIVPLLHDLRERGLLVTGPASGAAASPAR
jgi:hypothetical protein